MWAFTGHVAYSYDCERWKHGCGSCPYLGEYPALSRDTTAALWRWKDEVYKRSRLTIVAPSRWIEGLARESPLLSRFPVRRIPNGIDLELLPARRPRGGAAAARPAGRRAGRALLGAGRLRPPQGRRGAERGARAPARRAVPAPARRRERDAGLPALVPLARAPRRRRRDRALVRAPPTCSCCRRSPRTSRTRRSRASPAGRRASRSTSAACPTSCATSRPATSRRSATPPGSRDGRRGRCSATTSCARGSSARCRELAEEEFGSELEAARFAELYAELAA